MKRNYLLNIEKKTSDKWKNSDYHNSEVNQTKPKYFATFPYPYMNGKLHLGHAFTMCKVDFTARFKRLMGFNVLFPFGFHCTGMPICAAAKKLTSELETTPNIEMDENPKLQYNILKYYKLTHEEITKFTEPIKWVKYFSLEGYRDVRSFNLMVDLRRSFVTTNFNPLYDSFISYQFKKLHKKGLLKYGTRNSVYSPNLDIQCQDHDRSVGEGVGINEYILQFARSKFSNSYFIFVVKKSHADENANNHNYTILLNPNSKFVKFKMNDKTFYCSEYIYQNIAHQNLISLGELSNYMSIIETVEEPNAIANEFEQIKLIGKSISLSETIKSTSFDSSEMIGLVGYAVKDILLSAETAPLVTIQNNIEYNLSDGIFTTKLFYLLEDVVIDRSGAHCVVKPLPQWYINYADQEWKEKTLRLVKQRMCSQSEITKTLESNISKLHEWGVSRQFGLGTRLPCAPDELIDSLSDSTIYPAYYTIANFIQSNIFGVSNNNIKSTDFTFEVWDYIFSNTNNKPILTPNTSLTLELVEKMKESFNYWYPVDLRISGKDLLTNHLVMYLFNHSACFDEKYFPKTIFANGWILVDGVKMSKSNGNFITIGELIGDIPIDSIRMTLADSGDDLSDANFVCSNASDNNLLKIYDWVKHVEEMYDEEQIKNYRKGEKELIDILFVNLIQRQKNKTIRHYENLKFRDVLVDMFFGFNGLREKYKIYCDVLSLKLHKDLVDMFCFIQTILLNPIIPHTTEYVWTEILGSVEMMYNFESAKELIVEPENETFDNEQTEKIVTCMLTDWDGLSDLIKRTQSALVKNKKKKNFNLHPRRFKMPIFLIYK